MRLSIKKQIFLIIFILCIASTSFAQDEITPDVYDENTEITIKGEILDVIKPVRGPVVIKVKTENRVYNVLTAPIWYINRYNIDFKVGDRIEITGSKLISRNGELYIITRQCRCKGSQNTFIFRDEYMRPLWRGGMHRQ
ncbi:MAG: hypothetical protein N3A62_08170, partial [Thermodesulfovibrionales bacterium]|nr:hypothetical protein [Thermodesulfovibrionales bacterium]